jgi:hypothetical protein
LLVELSRTQRRGLISFGGSSGFRINGLAVPGKSTTVITASRTLVVAGVVLRAFSALAFRGVTLPVFAPALSETAVLVVHVSQPLSA